MAADWVRCRGCGCSVNTLVDSKVTVVHLVAGIVRSGISAGGSRFHVSSFDKRCVLFALCSCTLPHLEELELASTTLLPPNGDRLLRQLVLGAAGSLRRLDLHSSAVDGDLSMLAAATALTWLNLAGGYAGR